MCYVQYKRSAFRDLLTKEDFLAPYHFAAVVHDGGVGWLTSPLSLPSHAEEERLSSCCSIQARKGGQRTRSSFSRKWVASRQWAGKVSMKKVEPNSLSILEHAQRDREPNVSLRGRSPITNRHRAPWTRNDYHQCVRDSRRVNRKSVDILCTTGK